MKHIRFQLATVLLAGVFATTAVSANWSPATGRSIKPISGALVRMKKNRKFRFVDRSCESGCVERYKSSDGHLVLLVEACYSASSEDARRDRNYVVSEGRVIKRGSQLHRGGRRGERIVVRYPKDESGDKPVKIFWYHRGDICFSYIEAGSLELALDFERSSVSAEAWFQ